MAEQLLNPAAQRQCDAWIMHFCGRLPWDRMRREDPIWTAEIVAEYRPQLGSKWAQAVFDYIVDARRPTPTAAHREARDQAIQLCELARREPGRESLSEASSDGD